MSSSDIDLPPPRRKSCSECVKAKRRCSLRTPTCLRCAKRNLRCVYVGQKPQDQRRTRLDTPPVQVDFGIPGDPAYDFSNCLVAPGPMNDLILNNLDLGMYSDLLLPLSNQTYAAPAGPSPSPASSTVYSLLDYHRVTDICTNFVDSDLTCPSSRIAHAVNAMKNYHVAMARTNSTPFLHPRLYSATTPTSIVNAFTVCVLYVNKTPETEALAWRILDRNMMMLLDPMAQGGTDLELLARVQALILYQTIRIWDGGIRQRANAEAVMPVLEEWTGQLKKIRDGTSLTTIQDGQETVEQRPSSWESWILTESLSRTIITAYSLITTYKLLKSHESYFPPWATPNPWTLSRHLWEAPSSFDFYEVWEGKRHWRMSNVFFEAFLEGGGRAEDVDEFGRVLLVCFMGVDEARGWYRDTGGTYPASV